MYKNYYLLQKIESDSVAKADLKIKGSEKWKTSSKQARILCWLGKILTRKRLFNWISNNSSDRQPLYKMDNSISVELGQPEHGWLPVEIHYKDFHLNFAASDVLNNPTEELYNPVIKLNDN